MAFCSPGSESGSPVELLGPGQDLRVNLIQRKEDPRKRIALAPGLKAVSPVHFNHVSQFTFFLFLYLFP